LNTSAQKDNSVLRYVGVVEPKGKSSVSLQKYPSSHPFASLKGSDNIIAFTTKRFPNPLIVQGMIYDLGEVMMPDTDKTICTHRIYRSWSRGCSYRFWNVF
jgi:hypothetical protein